jgi:UDP-N-acetylglucosamine--N-acetylmuramyl-(pentapeptide) pyrophosphoryl-undecaprenol N-acetylglucosamine transferase
VNQRRVGPAIVLTGGGSGGHITPLLAVAAEIKRIQPRAYLIYIGQHGDNLADIPKSDKNIDESFFVRAGKFRRFHGEGIKQIFDIPTFIKNARDFVYAIIGFWQCRYQLKKIQPSIIFIKGGFIGVPVGLAAASLHMPYITHDSDAIPGLANRIIARWARLHAVALPAGIYSYPADSTITTGIPLQTGFVPVSPGLMTKYRHEIDIPKTAKLLFVIGGGLGAQRVNTAISEALPHLLNEFPELYVVQSAGRANEDDLKQFYVENLSSEQQGRVKVFGYLNDVYRYSGAADVVVTRAGATNLAEFALQGKACVIIPNPYLTSGHQLKNADYLAAKEAATVINETDLVDDPNRLSKQLSSLLNNPAMREELSKNISEFAKPEATKDLANLIIEQARLP